MLKIYQAVSEVLDHYQELLHQEKMTLRSLEEIYQKLLDTVDKETIFKEFGVRFPTIERLRKIVYPVLCMYLESFIKTGVTSLEIGAYSRIVSLNNLKTFQYWFKNLKDKEHLKLSESALNLMGFQLIGKIYYSLSQAIWNVYGGDIIVYKTLMKKDEVYPSVMSYWYSTDYEHTEESTITLIEHILDMQNEFTVHGPLYLEEKMKPSNFLPCYITKEVSFKGKTIKEVIDIFNKELLDYIIAPYARDTELLTAAIASKRWEAFTYYGNAMIEDQDILEKLI